MDAAPPAAPRADARPEPRLPRHLARDELREGALVRSPLALFVRSRRLHTLRREPAAQAKIDILAAYGKPLARSPIRIAVVDPETLRFSETSSTGKTFVVTVHDGRLTKQNPKPYAFVF